MNDKLMKYSKIIVLGVFLLVLVYAGLIALILHYSTSTYFSIENIGTLGDSFGPLTSLFSGLAFSGMFIAVLLQKEELSLQRKELQYSRKEFAKTADAQEKSAKLTALSSLLNEVETQISKLEMRLREIRSNPFHDGNTGRLNSELNKLEEKKKVILNEIEIILLAYGVNINHT